MTILQGTMQDGSVVPVQVDAQGRLVAEGLQGAQGPAGPAGPQGPTGPQGPAGDGAQTNNGLPFHKQVAPAEMISSGSPTLDQLRTGLILLRANVTYLQLPGGSVMEQLFINPTPDIAYWWSLNNQTTVNVTISNNSQGSHTIVGAELLAAGRTCKVISRRVSGSIWVSYLG